MQMCIGSCSVLNKPVTVKAYQFPCIETQKCKAGGLYNERNELGVMLKLSELWTVLDSEGNLTQWQGNDGGREERMETSKLGPVLAYMSLCSGPWHPI